VSRATPVVTVAGWLGAGKTTAMLDLVARLPGRSAVVVNDFGEARIDATLLSDAATITDIPGGCVCCTAPAGLAATIEDLLDRVRPDRVFIEPSGLARPQDVIDMLTRGALARRVERGPTLVLVDPSRLLDPPDGLLEQLEAADVLVANRCDLATGAALDAFRARAAALWPRPLATLETRHGVLPTDVLHWPPGQGPRASEQGTDGHEHDHDHAAHAHAHTRYAARSWILGPETVLRFDALRAAVEAPAIERVKGMFHTDIGWIRLDRAGGRTHVQPTPYRRDSRLDAIAADADALAVLDAALADAHVPAAATGGSLLTLVDASGMALELDRRALAALPGQVTDVGTLVPGRAGIGVLLAEVLALAAPGPEASFVVAAADGMTTAPVRVADAGGAVLVHGRDGMPLPDTEGGPFRLLVPTTNGERSRCANVKGVVRVRLVACARLTPP
jgi:G3E family GTPase